MKRPLFFAAVLMVITAYCAVAADLPAMLLGAGILTLLLLFMIWKIKLAKFYLLFIPFYLLSYYHAESLLQLPSFHSILYQEEYLTSGVAGELTGVIDSIMEKDTYYQLVVNHCTVKLDQKQDSNLCILVSISSISINENVGTRQLQPGDIVQLQGKVKAFTSPRNEGEFDSLTYYRSIGIQYKMSATSAVVTGQDQNQLKTALLSARERIRTVYSKIADEKDAGIYSSIVLGDKSLLDQDTKDLYQMAGIAHLLAISGLHIAMIGMTLYHLLRKLGLRFLLAGLISGFVILCYGILTGNGISATRATVMFLFGIVAEILGRTYDVRSAMSAAAMLLITMNPYVIYNSGFQLSFGAIIGISMLQPVFVKLWKIEQIECKWIRYLLQSFLVSLSINLVTAPVILYQYFQIPMISVLLNLIVIPLMSIVMISAILAGITGLFCLPFSMFMIGGAHYILVFYEFLCQLFLQVPGAIQVTGRPTFLKIIIYYILLISLIILGQQSRRIQDLMKNYKISQTLYPVSATFLCVVAILVLCLRPSSSGVVVRLIDVGQGDSILIQTPEGVNYLFDGGSTDISKVGVYRILPVIQSNAITCLDYVVISHSDSDHISGVKELMAEMDVTFTIKNLVMPAIKDPDDAYLELVDLACSYGIQVSYVNTGAEIGTDSVSITCLHPAEGYSYASVNDYSANYLVSYGSFDLLMTGDVEEAGEQAMLKQQLYTDIDLLKVAHHGSASSTTVEFLDAVQPELALISCGIHNSYGHPAQTTLTKLEERKIPYYVTSQCGEIVVKTDGSNVQIRSRYLK